MTVTNLLDLSLPQMEQWMEQLGEQPFRARQIWRWLYVHLADDLGEMTDLSAGLRERLQEIATCRVLTPLEEALSSDGLTRKTLFELPDGERIETVLMLYDRRATVCVSTQVGCAVGCPFCATGQGGFRRNLSSGEILGQVLHYARWLLRAGRESAGLTRVSNVVLMGMGEPLANYEATWAAVERLNHPQGFKLGARRMTLSTAGLVPGILRMAEEKLQVNLSISLHAATDELRDDLVPLNKRYPLDELMRACRAYLDRTHRRITFEYLLIAGVNDSAEQAYRLVERVSGLLCHVNLIPLNPTPGSSWRPSGARAVERFQDILDKARIPVTLREERGIDIAAACGQLRAHAQE